MGTYKYASGDMCIGSGGGKKLAIKGYPESKPNIEDEKGNCFTLQGIGNPVLAVFWSGKRAPTVDMQRPQCLGSGKLGYFGITVKTVGMKFTPAPFRKSSKFERSPRAALPFGGHRIDMNAAVVKGKYRK